MRVGSTISTLGSGVTMCMVGYGVGVNVRVGVDDGVGVKVVVGVASGRGVSFAVGSSDMLWSINGADAGGGPRYKPKSKQSNKAANNIRLTMMRLTRSCLFPMAPVYIIPAEKKRQMKHKTRRIS